MHTHNHSHAHPLPAGEAGRLMKRATWFALGTAFFLIILKTIAWWMTDSLSILSSLTDSLLDILASLLNFFAVRYSLRPADDEHRFGHGKAEDLAALWQAAFITGSGLFICFEGVHRLVSPTIIEHSAVGIAVMGISVLATALLLTYQRHVVRKTNSTAIKSDALHYYTDLLTNSAVILGLVLSVNFGITSADPIIALLIAIYIFYNAWEIGHHAFQKLMDREFADNEREHVIAIITQHPEVKQVHDLRTRHSGIQRFIQFSIALDDTISLLAAHQITYDLEQKLYGIFPDAEIIIHQEPLSMSGHAHNAH